MKTVQKYLFSKKNENPMVIPLKGKNSKTEGCQGCKGFFRNSDVMIIDGIGPVCLNCCYHLAERYV